MNKEKIVKKNCYYLNDVLINNKYEEFNNFLVK